MKDFLGFNYRDENYLANGKKCLREILINEALFRNILPVER